MPKMISKKNINSKNKLTKSKTQKGGKKYHSDILVSYNGSKQLPLTCSFCKKSNFKVKTHTLKTKFKDYTQIGLWSNRYKVFTCINCGHIEMFSNNIKCNGKKCDKSVFLPDLN